MPSEAPVPPSSQTAERYGSPGPSHGGGLMPRRRPYPDRPRSPDAGAPPRRLSPPPGPPPHMTPYGGRSEHMPPGPVGYHDDHPHVPPIRARSDPYAYHDHGHRYHVHDPRYDQYLRDHRDFRHPRDYHYAHREGASRPDDPHALLPPGPPPYPTHPAHHGHPVDPRPPPPHPAGPSPAVAVPPSGFTASPTSRTSPHPPEPRNLYFTPTPPAHDIRHWPRQLADAYWRGYEDSLIDVSEGQFTVDGVTHRRVPLVRPARPERPERHPVLPDDSRPYGPYGPYGGPAYAERRGSIVRGSPPPGGSGPRPPPGPPYEYYPPPPPPHLAPPYLPPSPTRGRYAAYPHPQDLYGPPAASHPLPMMGRQGSIASPAAPPPQMRHRQMISCHPCRSRKVKCSGGHPCDACMKIKRTDECKYETTVRRRGKGKKQDDKTDDGGSTIDATGDGSPSESERPRLREDRNDSIDAKPGQQSASESSNRRAPISGQKRSSPEDDNEDDTRKRARAAEAQERDNERQKELHRERDLEWEQEHRDRELGRERQRDYDGPAQRLSPREVKVEFRGPAGERDEGLGPDQDYDRHGSHR